MRKGFLAALTAILAGHGLAVAQHWNSNLPGHAWQPSGQVPAAPTMLRTWTPPGPALRPPVAPKPGPQHTGMAGWPPQGPITLPQMPVQAAPALSPTGADAVHSVPRTQQTAGSTEPYPPPSLIDPGLGTAPSYSPAPDYPPPPADNSVSVRDDDYVPPRFYAPDPEDIKRMRPFGIWGSADYLFWWFKDSKVPTLVSAGGTGVPGSSGVLLENLDFANEFRHGGRFSLGYQFKRIPFLGMETNFFFIADQEKETGFDSAGVPVLARPFLNATTGLPDASLIAAPGVAGGTIIIGSSTSMWGTESNAAAGVICDAGFHLALLGGFRYLHLEDELNIVEQFTASDAVPVFGGSTVGIQDNFRTVNRFYGLQFGAETGIQIAKLTVDFRGKVAIGNMHQVAYVSGGTGLLGPAGAAPTFPGGVLALPTNGGRYDHNELAFIPEVGLNIGLQVTHFLKLNVGYTFLYINNVARAGEQIDPVINVTQLPTAAGPGALVGPERPLFPFHTNDFWAQGLNFGIELRY